MGTIGHNIRASAVNKPSLRAEVSDVFLVPGKELGVPNIMIETHQAGPDMHPRIMTIYEYVRRLQRIGELGKGKFSYLEKEPGSDRVTAIGIRK